MVYFKLAVFTQASLYDQSTPSTAWRTSGHTFKQPYFTRGVVDATLPGLSVQKHYGSLPTEFLPYR